jgi:hypothetical protein
LWIATKDSLMFLWAFLAILMIQGFCGSVLYRNAHGLLTWKEVHKMGSHHTSLETKGIFKLFSWIMTLYKEEG